MSVCGLLPSLFRPSAAVLLHSSSPSSSSSSSFSESVESRSSSSSSSSRPKMDEKERVNGDRVVFGDADDDKSSLHHHHTLHGVVYALIATILFPDHTSPAAGESLLRRAKISFSHNGPLLPQASRNSGRHLLHWTRQGSPLRALLVISVSSSFLTSLSALFRSFINHFNCQEIIIKKKKKTLSGVSLLFMSQFMTPFWIEALPCRFLGSEVAFNPPPCAFVLCSFDSTRRPMEKSVAIV